MALQAAVQLLDPSTKISNKDRTTGRRYTSIGQSKKKLQEWIELTLGIQFACSFFEQLKSGVIVCDLLNAIKPGTCSKHEKSERLYIQKRNVSIYLSGCRSIGVPKSKCFVPNDLVSDYRLRSNQRKIINNMRHVMRIASTQQSPITPNDTTDVSDVYDLMGDEDNDDETQSIIVDTPQSKSKTKRKFKLKDYSISASDTTCEISPSSEDTTETMFHFSNPVITTFLDTQSQRSKELILSGYFRHCCEMDASVVNTIRLFVMGESGSVQWTLCNQTLDDFLDEEEDMLQYEKRLVMGNGSIVMETAISHNDGVLTVSIENVNHTKLIAYCYCKCLNNNRVMKRVYNSTNGVYNMDMDLMDITAWQKQNASVFKKRFLEVNSEVRKSAKYFRIPNFDEALKLLFRMELVSAYNNVNINKHSEFEWNCIDKVSPDQIFEDFEICSSNFGDDSIEYDKCWTVVAKYSEFYEQFYFALKLLKLPLKVGKLRVWCCLSVDGVAYTKTEEMALNNNCCEWDKVWVDPSCIHEKSVHISIEILEVADIEGQWIRKDDWLSYSIK